MEMTIKSIYHMLPFEVAAALILLAMVGAFIFVSVTAALWIEGGQTMKLSNKTYDILKRIAQIVLPAAGTLYFALSAIWNLPYGEQIVGTITAIDAFMGAVLGISTYNYNKEG